CKPPLGPVGLRIHAADELAVVKDRQRVVPVDALGPRRVDLDPVAEAEQSLDALAVPEQGVEGREQGRAARRRPPAGRTLEGRQVTRQGEPAALRAPELDLDDLAAL